MRKLFGWTLGAGALMLGLPWLAVTFAGSAGMAVCFLLFFAVNPLFALVCGLAAGKAMRRLWALPLITAGLFLLGTWCFFTPLETAFFLYAGIYLLISTAAMLLRARFHR